MQHDMYRPAVIAKFRAGLDQAGKPLDSPETGPGLESGQITDSSGMNRLAAAEQKSTA